MKELIIAIISFLLISCDDNSNENQESLSGNWRLVSQEEKNLDRVVNFPDTLDSYIFIEFTNDSMILYGCNKEIGWGTYNIDNGQLNIENFNYIEPCSLKGWVEITTSSISHALTYSLMNDSLKISSDNAGKYNLILIHEY